MSYDNLLFDQFIYGADKPNTNILKSEIVSKWFKHTESDLERSMFRAYQNIDYVMFLNEIDLDNIQNILIDLWSIYKNKYPYSSKDDYIKSFWQFSIYELEDFVKETYYAVGYGSKGFELWFCNDKNDITNNLWFFIDENKDPEYYKQYFKKVLEVLDRFKKGSEKKKGYSLMDMVNTLTESEKMFLKLRGAKGETIEEMRLDEEIKELRLQNLQNKKQSLEVKRDTIKKNPPKTPFTDQKTHDLFNYILDNWDYDKGLRFGYILNFLNSNEKNIPLPKYNLKELYGFKMGVKFQNDYIDFLGKEHGFYKDLQPEKAVSKRRYDELIKYYEEFIENYE